MEVVVAVVRLSENAVVDNLLVMAAIITAFATLVTLMWRALKPLKVRIEDFLDWQEEFRPQWEGYEAKHQGEISAPGVMERLSRIDGEFHRNGGSSMKDAIVKLSEEIESISTGLSEVQKDVCEINRVVKELHEDGKTDTP